MIIAEREIKIKRRKMKPSQIITDKASADPGRIVLPEGEDPRVIMAAAAASELGSARPILLGSKNLILRKAESLKVDITKVEIREHPEAGKLSEYVKKYMLIQEAAGKKPDKNQAESLLSNPVYFGAMIVREGGADGMVAGALNYSATVMRAAYRIVGLREGIKLFSSFLVVSGYKTNYGENGALIFADPSVNPDPSAEQLAEIALTTARSAEKLFGWEPRVALLSFSTMGSSTFKSVEKIKQALAIAREKAPELKIDGELQSDAALVPSIAAVKKAGGEVAGRANVLIFPNLDSGNISYKLIQHLSGADCYGPILQGFRKPVNDLSRGSTVEDITGVIGITSVQAQES